jgi:hypothetical protein
MKCDWDMCTFVHEGAGMDGPRAVQDALGRRFVGDPSRLHCNRLNQMFALQVRVACLLACWVHVCFVRTVTVCVAFPINTGHSYVKFMYMKIAGNNFTRTHTHTHTHTLTRTHTQACSLALGRLPQRRQTWAPRRQKDRRGDVNGMCDIVMFVGCSWHVCGVFVGFWSASWICFCGAVWYGERVWAVSWL